VAPLLNHVPYRQDNETKWRSPLSSSPLTKEKVKVTNSTTRIRLNKDLISVSEENIFKL
jgi:hypothetical protein